MIATITSASELIALRKALVREKHYLVVTGCFKTEDAIDVRLQVFEAGNWRLHSGDPQFDDDHTGYWGSGSLVKGRQNLTQLAQDLRDQAIDHWYQLCDRQPFTPEAE